MKYLLSIFEWGEQRVLSSDQPLKEGDTVVVDLGFGKHLGKICETLKDKKNERKVANSLENEGVILRRATTLEKDKANLDSKKRTQMMQKCRKLIKKYDLPMKLVGVDVSIDGGGIIFGFTAEERIDFRTMVRELAGIFQKSVRLQQLGSRDEARNCGGIGPCGRALCCLSNIAAMQSISTEMARLQQISHRGNERLSGCCNRLMCCLAFEQDTYEKLRAKLPSAGDRVKISSGNGMVDNIKILSQEVGVRLDSEPEKVIWVNVEELK
ncbi:MAG: regulatory iron-sulfur-containing complex subunit RicT [Candidatus Moraniibacteriota bacterium]